MFNLQRKLTHFPLTFCKIPPPSLIMYSQNIVSYSTVKIIYCTVVRSNFEKNVPYEHYIWLHQSIIISRRYSSPATQRSHYLNRPIVLKYAYFQTVCTKTMRLFSGHILSRNASNFPHSHLDFKKFSWGKTPGPVLTGEGKEGSWWERIKGFLHLKEGKGGKGQGGARGMRGKMRGRGRASGRGNLAPRS